MKSLALVFLIINYALFAWAVIGVFRNYSDKNMTPYRLIVVLSLITWSATFYEIYVAYQVSPSAWWTLIGLEILFGSLFLWSSFYAKRHRLTLAHSRDVPEVLITEGPFRLVRNPIYASYLGTYLAVGIMIKGPLTLIMCLVMLGLYWQAARFEEEKFESSALRNQFQAYKARTGMFFPRLLPKRSKPSLNH